MVTSHLLAVPNTESTNCYNLWLACLGHLQPLARHSLSSLISDYVSAFGHYTLTSFLRLRHKSSYNSGSSLRLLDYCFGRSSSDLEVIASAFLGTSLIINAAISLSNIAEIPNENHLIVQLAQSFAYQSVAFLCAIAQKALFICILDYINETDQKRK